MASLGRMGSDYKQCVKQWNAYHHLIYATHPEKMSMVSQYTFLNVPENTMTCIWKVGESRPERNWCDTSGPY